MNDKLYAVQVLTKDGWTYGPRLYGMDISTGLVGPYFVGNRKLAEEQMEKMLKTCGGSVRIVCFKREY